MKLLCSNREIVTVFDLLGDKENDMTFSLGWVFSISQAFLAEFLKTVTGRVWNHTENAVIKLQTGRAGHGITDIEIDLDQTLAITLEAKRGPELPSVMQLQRYAPALARSQAQTKYLVALTNATPAYASGNLPAAIQTIPLVHCSWREVKAAAERAAAREKSIVKLWLRHFVRYLKGLLQMEMRYSNLGYVVSLGMGTPPGWSISWIDIVEKAHRYFYPIGMSGWPDPPPNYIAFRYGGKLQSINHVESYDVLPNPHTVFPQAPNRPWHPHYCLSLGPSIRPARAVPVGPGIHRAARVWCMIDTLLTANTITDALAETKRRIQQP